MTQGINMPKLKKLLGARRMAAIRREARRHGGGNLGALLRIFDAGVGALAAPEPDPVVTRPPEPMLQPEAAEFYSAHVSM